MKIASKLILILAVASLYSCDSASLPNDGTDEDARATVLRQPANGDKIIFTNTDPKPDPFLTDITLTGLRTVTTNISYIYKQVSNYQFNLEVALRNNNASTLDPVLINVLGDPTPLGSRFRELIFRDEAVFTNAELLEIISFLNPSGASLFINPDDPLEIAASTNRLYLFEVRSNQGDKIRGSMGGVYYTEESSIKVAFRDPTPNEYRLFRFLTIKHKIPYITGIRNLGQVTERGTFVMDLFNRNNQPR